MNGNKLLLTSHSNDFNTKINDQDTDVKARKITFGIFIYLPWTTNIDNAMIYYYKVSFISMN